MELRREAEFPADVQQLLVVKEEVPPEQQEWISSLDQEDPEPPHIKEEQEERWTSQEGEQLQGLEEADITKFTFTLVPVKSEDDDEEKPQSSQLHRRLTEQMETEADGEDYGGPEPARNSDPDIHPDPDADDKTGDSTESETDDSDDWKETREPQSGFNYLSNDEVPVSDYRCNAGEKPFSCSECGKRFGIKACLRRHVRAHKGEKPFSCSVCKKSFKRSDSLQKHMTIHSRQKPFSCSLCSKQFSRKETFVHHMRIHTGEKPFSCSVCGNKFIERGAMTRHMAVHTGQKQFSCSVCDKRFAWRHQVKRHKCVGHRSLPLHQNQTEQMETEADGEDCGRSEPARNSDLHRHLQPDTDDNIGDCSEPDNDYSDD